MKGCHFQDVPCRRSLCLKGYLVKSSNGHEPSIFYCTEPMSSKCPHRAWDHEENVGLQRKKAALLKKCPSCGMRHGTMDERVRCVLDRSIDDILETSGTECTGTCDPVLPSGIPQELAPYAWRKIRGRVIERDQGRCRFCGRTVDGMPSWFFEVHHVVPRSEGGSDHPRNLVTLCYLCHRKITALSGSPERSPSPFGRF